MKRSPNRIDRLFQSLRRARRPALAVFLVCGDPSLAATERLIPALAGNGVDLFELGVPFSDPLADGTTIQRASSRALARRVTLRHILAMIGRLRRRVHTPIVVFSYFNPIHQMGLALFARHAARAGVDGVLVPDLPLEESSPLRLALSRYGIYLSLLIAPTTPSARARRIARASQGYVYYVSRTGVTGARGLLPSDLVRHLKRLRSFSRRPVIVGFGLSRPSQLRRLRGVCDGAVVGSALVQTVERSPSSRLIRRMGAQVHALAKALGSAR